MDAPKPHPEREKMYAHTIAHSLVELCRFVNEGEQAIKSEGFISFLSWLNKARDGIRDGICTCGNCDETADVNRDGGAILTKILDDPFLRAVAYGWMMKSRNVAVDAICLEVEDLINGRSDRGGAK